MSLRSSIPVYVTRRDADGLIASYEMPLWMSLFGLLMVWLNIMVWSLIGLVLAGTLVAGALL
jgi:hypothetical protein